MNILNAGGWYVGNTAILDWMDGFEELAIIKGDLNIMRLENGIMDILSETDTAKKLDMISYQKKMSYKSLYLIFRSFIARNTKNIGNSRRVTSHVVSLKFNLSLFQSLIIYERKLKRRQNFDEFDYWRNWLSLLPAILEKKRNYVHAVFQNPFFYDETFNGHSSIWQRVYAPYKLIFVHRDPLDQFSDIVNSGSHLRPIWLRFHGETESLSPADRFLEVSRKIYHARLKMTECYDAEQLAIFSFEDFLMRHEEISDKLKKFLNVRSERNKKNKRFVLEESLKNIGKGKYNHEALKLLAGKNYVMDELNELRSKLISSSKSL